MPYLHVYICSYYGGLPDTQPWLHQKFTVDGMYAFRQNDGLGYRQMSSDESNR